MATGTFCDVLAYRRDCRGHFNPEGNRIVADAVERYIVGAKLLRAAPAELYR